MEKTTLGSMGQECPSRCPVACPANQFPCPLTYDCDGCVEEQVCAEDLSQCPVPAFNMDGCPSVEEPTFDPQYEMVCMDSDVNVSYIILIMYSDFPL